MILRQGETAGAPPLAKVPPGGPPEEADIFGDTMKY